MIFYQDMVIIHSYGQRAPTFLATIDNIYIYIYILVLEAVIHENHV